MLPGLLPWTIVVYSRTFRALWWLCIMPSGTGLPDTKQAGVNSAARDPLPRIFRGFDLTMQSDRLYDLDSGIPDVIGLRALQLDAAVIKIMLILDNRCIRVVIPDDHVGTGGFHEILIHDMADADDPYVAVSELGSLRLDWPKAIFSFMGRHQVDLEHLCHGCPVWIVYLLWKVYSPRSGPSCHQLSFGFGPALAVPWCTIWRGMPQDCIDHMRRGHTVPATVQAANVFSCTGTHVAFHGAYMARLRTFLNAADAACLESCNRRRARSLASQMSPEVPVGGHSREPADLSHPIMSRLRRLLPLLRSL